LDGGSGARHRPHLQQIDFGEQYQLVFELRPAHDPARGIWFRRNITSKSAARRHDVARATSRRAQSVLSDRSAPDRAIKCASSLPPADVPEFGTPIAKAKGAVDGWYA
jgi:hypothetical protein